MEIKLSEIQIVPIKPRNGLLAFVSFILNDAFYVGDIGIYSRLNQEGYRLVYPLKVLPNGLKINSLHPINREVAQAIEDQVIKAFMELTEKVMTKAGKSNDGYSREG